MTLRTEKALVSITLAAIFHPTFQYVAATNGPRSVLSPSWLVTPLDAALPVIPSAVWLYVSWYPASGLVLFTGRPTLRRSYISYAVAFIVCLACYVAAPVAIARPAIEGRGISAILLRAVYAADQPTNLFPSFHGAVAAILLSLRPPSRIVRVALVCWMVAICIACVLTKQHYVLDVVAGLVVGLVAVTIADALLRKPFEMPLLGQHRPPPEIDCTPRLE